MEDRGCRPQILARLAVDDDPQEASFGQVRRQAVGKFDVPVAAVGVVQPGARAGVRRRDQRSDPSSSAPAMARTASPYWRTSMARSAPRPVVRISVGLATEVGR